MKQEDLIVRPDEQENIRTRKSKDTSQERTSAPVGYFPIRLSTKGKLSLPALLHFRNYDVNEIIELASVPDNNDRLFSLIKCLNNMVYEDVDLNDAHEKEIVEIMMLIYFSYNGTELGPYPYYINDKIKDVKLLESADNQGEVTFTAKDLDVTNIREDFKEPISIWNKDRTKKFKFRLPRVKDNLFAIEYCENKYKEEKERFAEIAYRIQYNQNKNVTNQLEVKEDEKKAYQNYLKSKDMDLLKVTEASLLTGDENREFTLEDSLELLENQKIDLGYWIKLNNIMSESKFGIKEEVTFKDPKTKESVTRRFLFQASDFVPDLQSNDSSGYDFSFGD